MTISNIKAVILGGLQQVWELILDIENYATWRSVISNLSNIPKMAILRHLQ